MDMKAPSFSTDVDLYKEQLVKDLAVNVLKDGLWGSYRHFPIQVFANEPVEHAFVNTTVRGDLSSLSWLQGPVGFKLVFTDALVFSLFVGKFVAQSPFISLISCGLGKRFCLDKCNPFFLNI